MTRKTTIQTPAADQPDDGSDAENRAAGGRHGLAALLEPEEDRPRVPDHGRASREHAGQRSGHLGGDERGHEPLRDVEEHDGHAVPPAERTPDVRRADVPAADGADVDVLRRAHEPVPEGHGPDEVGRGDEERRRHRSGAYGRMPYASIQSFTTVQSRLSKNASMYEPRSVW